jgi:hypothetical protein
MPFHSSLSCAVFLALAIGAAAFPAHAQDIYIKPSTGSDGSGGSPSVEYGLKTRPKPAPKPDEFVPPIPVLPSPTTPSPTPIPPPAPFPTPTTPAPSPVPPNSDTEYLFPGATPFGNSEATVYQMPEDPAPNPGQGPNSLAIKFQPGGLGVNDRGSITRSLGLNDKEIQSGCALRHSTMLEYGQQEIAALPSGTAPSVQYRFAGPLSSIKVSVTAACRKMKKPVAGMILEQGNFYVLTLSTIDCAPSGKGSQSNVSLNFRYTGDGTGECRYQ